MVAREVDQAGDEAAERVGAQEEAHRAPVGHGEHADRRLVQPLLRGAEQLLAGQAGDHFQHLLAGVGLEGEPGAVDGAAHPALHHRDVQHALVQRGHGEAAEEAVLAGAATLAVEGGDGEVVGVHGLERARRVGPGDHQGFAAAAGLVGDGTDLGAAGAVAEHAEPGRDVGRRVPSGVGDVVAVAEEREVAVDEPAQQRRDVGLRGAAGGGGSAASASAISTGARPHRLGVRDDLAHVAQHAGELRFQLVGRHGRAGPARGASTTRPACRAAVRRGRRGSSTSASLPSGARRTTTMGCSTRRTSPPAREMAASSAATRNGMSSVTVSTTRPPSAAVSTRTTSSPEARCSANARWARAATSSSPRSRRADR